MTDCTHCPSNNVTVRELIGLLEKFDPEASVLVDPFCRPPVVRPFNGSTEVVLIGSTAAHWVDPRRQGDVKPA